MAQLMPLEESLEKSGECIDLLVNNRFFDAVQLGAQHAENSLYHSHCHSLLLVFKAYLSLEMPEIKKAQKASDKTIELCNTIRPPSFRDNFIVKLFVSNNYSKLSEEEVHAELVRAEQTIFGTLLELFVDQSFFVLVKVSYRLRSCYMMYNSFATELDRRQWSSPTSRAHFKTGVAIGQGVFNLVFLAIPDRIMAVLSMIGFKGSHDQGLELLKEACAITESWRSFGAQIILSAYECYIGQMFNVHVSKAIHTEEYIEMGLKKNSLSIWYLIFKARALLISHDINGSLRELENCLSMKNIELKEILNFYYWDIMWTHSLMSNWKKAYEFANKLLNNCQWSDASFTYLKATFLIMDLEKQIIEGGVEFEKSIQFTEQREKIDFLLKEVPRKIKRYAGRRLPFEKFACLKVIKYEREGRIISPIYEFYLMYNILIYIEGQEQFVGSLLNHVEKCLHHFHLQPDSEDYLLLKLMQGIGNRLLGHFEKAQECLLEVVNKQEFIVEEQHLICFATLELGICAMDNGEYAQAKAWIIRAKTEIDGHPMELFIQLRAQKIFRMLRNLRQTSTSIEK